MKLAKLFAYLGISIFIPLWLFILMDTKLEEENKDRSLSNKLKTLFKSHDDFVGINPATNNTINQPLIQFTYSPKTTYLTNPSEKGGMPFIFPEYIKMDTESFKGIIDELKNLKGKVSSDIQSINSSLIVLNGNQNAKNEFDKDSSNVFRYGFSEKDMPAWIVKNIKNNDAVAILILKNKSKIFSASLTIESDGLKFIKKDQTDSTTLEPNEEIALKYDSNLIGQRADFIKVTFIPNNPFLEEKPKTLTVIRKN